MENLPIPVHPFLFVHNPEDMKQLMKEATTACMCQINAIFKNVLGSIHSPYRLSITQRGLSASWKKL